MAALTQHSYGSFRKHKRNAPSCFCCTSYVRTLFSIWSVCSVRIGVGNVRTVASSSGLSSIRSVNKSTVAFSRYNPAAAPHAALTYTSTPFGLQRGKVPGRFDDTERHDAARSVGVGNTYYFILLIIVVFLLFSTPVVFTKGRVEKFTTRAQHNDRVPVHVFPGRSLTALLGCLER